LNFNAFNPATASSKHLDNETTLSAVVAPPIGDTATAITLESTSSNINGIQSLRIESMEEEGAAYNHDEDISSIAGIVPPTGTYGSCFAYSSVHATLCHWFAQSHPPSSNMAFTIFLRQEVSWIRV
jgi:hypothetical protein